MYISRKFTLLTCIALVAIGGCDSVEPDQIDLKREASMIPWDRIEGTLAYSRSMYQDGSYRSYLFVAEPENRSVRLVHDSDHSDFRDLAWMPDGRHLVYSGFRVYSIENASWSIFRISIDGGEPERIGGGWKPAPGADGRIAFPAGESLFIDGVRLSLPLGRWAERTRPAWGPGQQYLVASLETAGISQGVLHRVTLQGRATLFLAGTPVVGEIFHDPQFSPDGEQLAYVRWGGFSQAEIWLADASGANARAVTTGHGDWQPSWSPSGSQLAFKRKFRLYIVNADGSGLRQIVPDMIDSLAWLVPG